MNLRRIVRRPRYIRVGAASLFAIAFVFWLSVANAQSNPAMTGASGGGASMLQEIVVTATKRRENLQEVPASIEALSANALQTAQITSLTDLSHAVPGFSVTQAEGTYNTLVLRGIGTASNAYSVAPSVGLNVDDAPIGRPSAMTFFPFYDVKRIEVLPGPQGTLFGMNTSAGLIRVITNDPTQVPDAGLTVGYGTYNDTRVNGFMSGPLLQNVLSGRLAFFSDNHDGYIRNIYTGKYLNDNSSFGGRAKFLITPTSRTKILLSADYQRQIGDCCAMPVIAVNSPTDNPLFYGGYPYLFAGFPSGFIHSTNASVDTASTGLLENISKGVSIKLDQDIGEYTLTSITAHRKWNATWNQALGFNTTPVYFANPFDSFIHQEQTSQEIRIASPTDRKINYVAGVFFFDDTVRDHEQWNLDFAPLLGTPVGAATAAVNYMDITRTVNGAAFGQANIHITHRVTLIAGVRETVERATFGLGGHYYFDEPMQAAAAHTVHNVSWKTGARWQATRLDMLYITVSRGFKGPGFNGNSTILGNAQYVKPEVSTNYEMGWKSDLLNRKLRLDLAAFYETIDNFQVNGDVTEPGQVTAVQFLVNAPQMRTKGVEAEIQAIPMQHLRVNFNGSLNDAYYESFPNAPCYGGETVALGCVNGNQNLSGQRTPGGPRYAFDTNGTYDIDLPTMPFSAYVSADYAWQGSVEWDETNNPIGVESGYGLLGAAIGLVGNGGHFSTRIYGKNLTNKYHTIGYFVPNDTYAQAILPMDYKRIFGVTFSYRY